MDTNITGLSTGYESQFDQAKANRIDVKAEALQAANEEKKAQEVAKKSPETKENKEVQEIDEATFNKGLEDLNKTLLGYGLGVSFDTDSDTRSQIIQIFDKETSEVIKQYPSEDALALVRSIQNYLSQQQAAGTVKPELTGALFNEVI